MTDMGVFTVGDVVRKLRQERKWSIRQLAKETKISRMTISAFERDKSNYQKETLEGIAKVFGLTGADLEALVNVRQPRTVDPDLPAEWVAFTRRVVHLSSLGQGAMQFILLALEEADAKRHHPDGGGVLPFPIPPPDRTMEP
jgi:transcriptional regulator with XRE-family HTH domain